MSQKSKVPMFVLGMGILCVSNIHAKERVENFPKSFYYMENQSQAKELNMNREETKIQDTWDLTPMFKAKEAFEAKLDSLNKEAEQNFPQIAQENLDLSPSGVKKLLESFFSYMRELELVYTYAHLKHDEDISFTENKEGYERAVSLYHQYMSAASWIEPALLQLSEEDFEALLESKELKEYKFYLTKLKDQKDHILTSDKEEMMSLASRMQGTASSAFSALSNADLSFGTVKNGEGEDVALTKASFGKYMKSKDRVLRENAFNKLHQVFLSYENTFAELVHGNVQNHIFNAKVRSYENCLEAALKPHNIPLSVYHNLIDSVSNKLDLLHRYVTLRKKALGLEKQYLYDLQVSLVDIEPKKYTFEEACEIVIESVAILGKEYQDILRKGLLEDRWVDVYENKGKRSGAYSSGCYDSSPYILMNFQGTLNDVLTLSHEAGHSMNSYLSNKKQNYHDADYTIFVAEVASTFNEQLTYDYLYQRAESKEERIYLLNQQIDAIKSTFFRQAMFAEFELKIHEMAEKHVPLTPDVMKKLYRDLNTKYYGKDLEVTEEASGEFLRVPHFFYNFYVYQYSTGIAAALTLVDKVRDGAIDPYMGFLAAGGSDYSIEILKSAGADMSTKEPIDKTLEKFSSLLQKLEKEFE